MSFVFFLQALGHKWNDWDIQLPKRPIGSHDANSFLNYIWYCLIAIAVLSILWSSIGVIRTLLSSSSSGENGPGWSALSKFVVLVFVTLVILFIVQALFRKISDYIG